MTVDIAAVKARFDFAKVAAARPEVGQMHRRGNSFMCCCPFHNDTRPSFEISTIYQNGKCWSACNWTGDVLDFIMKLDSCTLTEAVAYLENGLFEPDQPVLDAKKSKRAWVSQPAPEGKLEPASFDCEGWPIQGVWCYRGADGQVYGYQVRYKHPTKGKEYRPWTYGMLEGGAKPAWKMAGYTSPRPLYGLPKLAAKPEAQVIVVEGEKAADAAQELFPEAVAVTWWGGSNAVAQADWSPLYGRKVVVIPDNDVSGRQAAWAICDRLKENKATVALCEPEDTKPPKWDMADAKEEGWTPEVALKWARDRKKEWPPPDREADPALRPKPTLSVVGGTDAGDASKAPAPESVPFSDAHLARQFVALHGQDWRFEYRPSKTWRQWDGTRWRLDRTQGINHAVLTFLSTVVRSELGEQLTPRQRQALEDDSKVASVVRVIGYDPRIAVTADEWDTDPWLLVTPGGTVELKTGTLRANVRDDMCTRCTPVSPSNAPATKWLDWLDTVTCGDKALAAYLRRVAGYCLTGSIDAQAFWFFYGSGGNGKGTFIRMMKAILGGGEYFGTVKSSHFLEANQEPHAAYLMAMRGKRFLEIEETSQHAKLDIGKVKNLTGGDDVSANRMHGEWEEFTPTAKLIFASNHKPSLRAVDPAIRRRMRMVPWSYSIPDALRNPRIEKELIAECAPAVLQWAIEGCLEYQRVGLKDPPSVVETSSRYFQAEDVFGSWLDECTETDSADNFALSRELFQSYCVWTEQQKGRPLTEPKWRMVMDERGFNVLKIGGVYAVKAIKLGEAERRRIDLAKGGWGLD